MRADPPSPLAVITSATGLTIVSMLPMFLCGALAVQLVADLRIDRSFLGLSVGVFLGLQALGAPFGRIVDRHGARTGLRVAAVGTGLSALAIATVVRSGTGLVAALIVAGTANALVQPAASAAISRAVVGHRQGVGFGAFQSSKPAGALLAGGAVPALALTLGWRWAYVACAALAIVLGATVPAMERPAARPHGASHGDRVRGGALALFMVATALGFGSNAMFSTFLVSAAVDSGWGAGAAGLLLSTAAGVAIVTRMVAGVLVDRGRGELLRAVAIMMLLGAGGFLMLALGRSALVVPGAVLAGATAWGYTGLYLLALTRLQPQAPASITGVIMAGGSIGAFSAPIVFGTLAERVSFQAAWYVGAGWLIAGTVALYAAMRRVEARPVTARTPVEQSA